ncbi:MAG: hypothetical protein ABF649_22610 [Bacillus sp. (in: firmicutes)]
MKNNFTVLFLFLFIAAIVGGLALKNTFENLMIVAVGVGTIFLLCSAFFAGQGQKNTKVQ